MKKHYKAMTEFCWCGVRYTTGEVVDVDSRSAKKLLASRLIFEVSASSIEQDKASGKPPAKEKGKDDVDKKKKNREAKSKPKQQSPPRDKQITGGRNK